MLAALAVWMGMAAQGGVVSQQWSNGKLTLQLDDGSAELEWISSVAFRFTRSWGERADTQPAIAHERVTPEMSEANGVFTLRSRYLRVELDRADLSLHLKNGETPVASAALEKTPEGVKLRLGLGPNEKVFGLMGGETGRLNLRGERLERQRGFMFTSAGYGIFVRAPARCMFDLASGTIEAPGARSIDYFFYYGPTPKEIFEQHQIATGPTELKEKALDVLFGGLPPEATPLPKEQINTWDALGALVRRLNQWSLSAVLYPALDLASFDRAPTEVRQRAVELSTLLPIVSTSGAGSIDRSIRDAWKPYLITYLREAHDRGYPLIRPLVMEFSRDQNADRQSDVFMLGDELLLAPVVGPGGRRRLELPMGIWTDLRANTEYRGRQTVEVDAPPGLVPMFIRNGSLVPLAGQGKMELHYFPSLAAEFFLWEPGNQENSQFHAAPAGDLIRLEVETQVLRTYEWVIHHTKAAREVAEASGVYQRVTERAMLKPGTWWHDPAQNDLHVMLRAETGSDRVVNISF
jgi:alpha-glucosidase (family GH31 glycosyl hydrolase)